MAKVLFGSTVGVFSQDPRKAEGECESVASEAVWFTFRTGRRGLVGLETGELCGPFAFNFGTDANNSLVPLFFVKPEVLRKDGRIHATVSTFGSEFVV